MCYIQEYNLSNYSYDDCRLKILLQNTWRPVRLYLVAYQTPINRLYQVGGKVRTPNDIVPNKEHS